MCVFVNLGVGSTIVCVFMSACDSGLCECVFVYVRKHERKRVGYVCVRVCVWMGSMNVCVCVHV